MNNNTPADLLDITAPYLDYSHVWWWVVSFVIIGSLVAVFFWFSNIFNPKADEENQKLSKTMLKMATVRELDKVYLLTMADRMDMKESVQRVSLALRTHFQNMGVMPASTMTLSEFKRFAPPSSPASHILEEIYPLIFSPTIEIESKEEFRRLLNKARYVIEADTRMRGIR